MVHLFGRPDIDKLEAERNVPGLIKALNYRPDGAVRARAAQALGRLRDRSALGALSKALDHDPKVLVEALMAIDEIEHGADREREIDRIMEPAYKLAAEWRKESGGRSKP